MLYFLTATALIAHTYFWGAGLACLVTPRPWRTWWWALAPGLGWALQSAVVWFGAHTALSGTDTYAWGTQVLPLALLAVVIWRWRGQVLTCPRGVFGLGLGMVIAVGAWLFLSPMAARGGWTLTTSSLGSNDQADYAAGARVFKEFSRTNREGFLGQVEVTRVRSVDFFFDYWLELNHFTPSALIAHNATVLRADVHQLVSVSTAVVVLLNVPLVMLLASAVAGIRGGWLLGVAALYAWSPLNAYAVHHGALGQTYAAQGIGLLALAVVGSSRSRHRGWRTVIQFSPVMLAGWWLLAGSYNFILTVCLAPAVAWLGLWVVVKRDWAGTLRVVTGLVVTLVTTVILFHGRFEGIVERFSLLEEYNFGWFVPLVTPEGWLGLVRNHLLEGWATPVRVMLAAVIVGLWMVGVVMLYRRRCMSRVVAAVAFVVPVVAGWAILSLESRVRANASYDAYKILGVFLPELIVGLWACVGAVGRLGRAAAAFVGVGMGTVLVGNLYADQVFARAMAQPPLRVERHLLELSALESDARFRSFNMLLDDFWSRLWGNALLLRKEQFFPTHSYEARKDTPLDGEWNLRDQLLRALPERAEDFSVVNRMFYLVRADCDQMRFSFGEGWHAQERDRALRWRWSSSEAEIHVENSNGAASTCELRLEVRAPRPRTVKVRLNNVEVAQFEVGVDAAEVALAVIVFPVGRSQLRFETDADVGGPDDARRLGFSLNGFESRVLRLGD
jgi:hypothetical protein